VYAQLGKWREALGDYSFKTPNRVIKAEVEQRKALVLLAMGDRKGYQQHCRAMLRIWRDLEPIRQAMDGRIMQRSVESDRVVQWSETTANSIAWTCSVIPDAVADFSHPLALARIAANDGEHAGVNTLGIILYRTGQFDESLRVLANAIETHSKGGTAWDWLFVAMANQQLSRSEKAKEALKKAIDQIDDTLNKGPVSWRVRLELQTFRAEAESLIQKETG
jgi:tetratricopeptide (TPR) repeat protein